MAGGHVGRRGRCSKQVQNRPNLGLLRRKRVGANWKRPDFGVLTTIPLA